MKAKHGEPMKYLLAHMRDGCCYPWPFAKQSAGYPHLYIGGKLVLASRFVCASVHGDAPEGMSVVRHKCGNGGSGCFNADCLEWGTPKQNTNDARNHGTLARGERVGTSKLKEHQVQEIKNLCGTIPQSRIATMFGVSQSLVSLINRGERW